MLDIYMYYIRTYMQMMISLVDAAQRGIVIARVKEVTKVLTKFGGPGTTGPFLEGPQKSLFYFGFSTFPGASCDIFPTPLLRSGRSTVIK